MPPTLSDPPLAKLRQVAHRRAFSLTETIVVIAIVVVILALSLPALAAARRAQMKAQSLANLRSVGQIAAMYSGDNAGRWMGVHDWDQAGNATFGTDRTFPFFAYDMLWPAHAVAAGYADEALLQLRSPYEPDVPRPYAMSCTMMTDARFWSLDTRTGPAQYGSPGLHDIPFPAEKTAFVDLPARAGPTDADGFVRDPRPIFHTAGVDGSAEASRASHAEEVSSGDGPYPGSIHPAPTADARHSVGGTHARDR